MARRQRDTHCPARAGILDYTHRNGIRVGRGVRAHLSGLADHRSLAAGTGLRRRMARPAQFQRSAIDLAAARHTNMAIALAAHRATLLQCPGRNFMAVSQELLDILVCPQDKTPVKLTSDQRGLKCPSCHRVYPIREDIPVMLIDEARIEAD